MSKYTEPLGVDMDFLEKKRAEKISKKQRISARHEYYQQDAKGENIAHARVYNRVGRLWLTDVWVDPAYRRQGRAGALLTALLADLGTQPIYLELAPYTDQPLDEAQLARLYGRAGFVATDVPGVLYRAPGALEGR